MNEEKFHCTVCGKEISREEYKSHDGLCWECWDDQMTEENLEDITGDFL